MKKLFLFASVMIGSLSHLISADENTPQKLPSSFANYLPINDQGNGLYVLSGQGCRDPKTNAYRGIADSNEGKVYDVEEVVKAVFNNVGAALKSAQLSFSNLTHLTVYMVRKKDYAVMNRIWNKIFPVAEDAPTRTTIFVNDLPGDNIVEMDGTASSHVAHAVDEDVMN
jgi:enamine deaminase RidA (YjgF/YER057c/UK114 family)